MYSNSLPSQSIHTPTQAFCLQMQQMLFCCCFFFFLVFRLQMLQLKCVKMMTEMWNEDRFPKKQGPRRPA